MSNIQQTVEFAISAAQSQDVSLVFVNGELSYLTGNTALRACDVLVCELPHAIDPRKAYLRCKAMLYKHNIRHLAE